jgi:hypothetical protein
MKRTGLRVYIGGPWDGREIRCIPASRIMPPGDRWPLNEGFIKRRGARHRYDLDVVESTGDRAVYRYVGEIPVCGEQP